MVEANKDSNIQELVFGDAQVIENGAFRDKREGRVSRSEVQGCDNFVNPRIEEGVSRPKYGMNVRFRMSL